MARAVCRLVSYRRLRWGGPTPCLSDHPLDPDHPGKRGHDALKVLLRVRRADLDGGSGPWSLGTTGNQKPTT